MHPQLQSIADELREATARLHRLSGAIRPDRWSVRNDPARWSIAECVEHLNLTSAAYVPILEAGLSEARKLRLPAPHRLRRGFMGWLLWKLTGPGFRGRMQTVPAFVPPGTTRGSAAAAEFERWQSTLLALLTAADGLPVGQVQLRSPFNAKVRYSWFGGFAILAHHQHRHLQQAERVWAPAG